MEERNDVEPFPLFPKCLSINEQPSEQQTVKDVSSGKITPNSMTHLKSMIRVPTRLATLVLAKAIDNRRITLAVVKLKSTSTRMNFQNVDTSGTRPINP